MQVWQDILLIPEIPYDLEVVAEAIRKRTKAGKHFTIIAAAEGAISKEEAALSKSELKAKRKKENYPSAAYRIGAEILQKTGLEVRVTVPGHVQRGGQPCAYDRVLATRLGAKTAELILQKKYGYMTCVKENKIDIIPISEVAGKTKLVDTDSDIIRQAKFAGLSFGDEPCGI